MTTRTGVIVIGLFVATLLFASCFGGSTVRVNTAKVKTIKKVALAGLCIQKQVSTISGTQNTGFLAGNGAGLLLEPMAVGLNEALTSEWKGIEVLPLAIEKDPARALGKSRACVNDLDPMLPGGYVGDADNAYLGTLAKKLGVDAVLAVSGDPIIRFWEGKGAKMYVPSIGSGFVATLVDSSGAELALIELKNFETEYFASETPNNMVGAGKLGTALSKLMAQGIVTTLNGGTFNPPSKPGLSGL